MKDVIKRTAHDTIQHQKNCWKEGWLLEPKTLQLQIAQAIYCDISDRRGLKQELEKIDGDIVEEMLDVWAEIINKMTGGKEAD